MNGAATVSEVQLYATHDAFSEASFYNSEILLCHTSVAELSTSFEANYSGNTPYSVRTDDTLAIDWTAPGWNGLTFDRGFDYDGVDNLIIEFRYLGEDGRTINTKGFYPPSPNRTLDAGLPDSPTGDLLTFMNSLRIYYTPSSGTGGPEFPGGLELSAEPCPSSYPCFRASMPFPGSARLDIYSIDGRRLEILDLGWLEAGEHILQPEAGAVPSGVCLARLEACGETATARVVIIRD
jgi:hypothetical protein